MSPVAYTPRSKMGALLIDAMDPWITLHLAWWLDAIGSMFDPVYELVYDVGVDGTAGFVPGYGSLLDPTLADPSNLAYLGQFGGVQIPVGTDPATALALVVAESGQKRGTLGALGSAIARNISTPWAASTDYVAGVMFTNGNPASFYLVSANYTSGATFGATDLANAAVVDPASQYAIVERLASDGSANGYWVTVRVSPEQLVPVSDATAITAEILSALPGGILLNLVASDSPTWAAATLQWTQVAGTVEWQNVKTGDV